MSKIAMSKAARRKHADAVHAKSPHLAMSRSARRAHADAMHAKPSSTSHGRQSTGMVRAHTRRTASGGITTVRAHAVGKRGAGKRGGGRARRR